MSVGQGLTPDEYFHRNKMIAIKVIEGDTYTSQATQNGISTTRVRRVCLMMIAAVDEYPYINNISNARADSERIISLLYLLQPPKPCPTCGKPS